VSGRRIVVVHCGLCTGKARRDPVGWIIDHPRHPTVRQARRRQRLPYVTSAIGSAGVEDDSERVKRWADVEGDREGPWLTMGGAIPFVCATHGHIAVNATVIEEAIFTYRDDARVRHISATSAVT
jgi:hypothetical protein